MRIGFDIDGVLYPWTDAANDALAAKFGGRKLGEHLHWDWLKGQIPSEQWRWLWSAEGQRYSFGHVERIYPGVVDAVNAILRVPENRVHFVTHRDPRRTAEATARFLARHFGGHPWAGVHVVQNNVPKFSLAEWDVFVDDKPETVEELLTFSRAQVFTPARPWNEGLASLAELHPRLIRYEDPAEVAEWVLERS